VFFEDEGFRLRGDEGGKESDRVRDWGKCGHNGWSCMCLVGEVWNVRFSGYESDIAVEVAAT
jgi:hypothetical protein